MAFVISSIDYDQDIVRIASIEIAAYTSSDKSLEEVLFPADSAAPLNDSSDSLNYSVSRLRSDETETALVFLKLVDTRLVDNTHMPSDPEAIIAFARWKFYSSDKLEQIKYPSREELVAHFGLGCNIEAVKEYFGDVVEAKKRLYGVEPHARKLK